MKITDTFYSLRSRKMLGMRICLVADSHNCCAKDIILSIKNNKPDIITICGDFLKIPPKRVDLYYNKESSNRDSRHINGADDARELLDFCSDFSATFLSIGNHESHFDTIDNEYCNKRGLIVLDNEYTVYKDLCIGGVSSGYKELITREIKGDIVLSIGDKTIPISENLVNTTWIEDYKKLPKYKVLLCHHPEYYKRLFNPDGIDLILCGHAHGGLVRLFGRGFYAHGQGFFPRYTSGIIDQKMIISRGISHNSVYIPRVFNVPEIIYVDI